MPSAVETVTKLMREYLIEELDKEEVRKMNPCKVEGCGKTDDEKAMAFRGEPYCSDVHRKVLSGELTLVKTETISVEATTTNENSVVE